MLALILAGTLTAHAVPPLVFVFDTATPGLETWWRPGDLLLSRADDPGGMALRPLVSAAPILRPTDMTGWTQLGSTCPDSRQVEFELDGGQGQARALGTWEAPLVQIWLEGRLVSEALLGRPAQICSLTVAEADDLKGPEVMVNWRMSEGGAAGLTVYRIPATAR